MNSPRPATRIQSSPNSRNALLRRRERIGVACALSMLRKKMRTRAFIRPSRYTSSIGSYAVYGSQLAAPSNVNSSSWSGDPGIRKPPMSKFVVTPSAAE